MATSGCPAFDLQCLGAYVTYVLGGLQAPAGLARTLNMTVMLLRYMPMVSHRHNGVNQIPLPACMAGISLVVEYEVVYKVGVASFMHEFVCAHVTGKGRTRVNLLLDHMCDVM